MRLFTNPDYDGHNLFWYFDEFDLYEALNCRILDRIIVQKWYGKYDIDASFADFSTSYTMILD